MSHRFVYAHKLRKQLCPNCGHRTLRTYIDTGTGEEYDHIAGTCERINSCQYHYTPWDHMRDSNTDVVPPFARKPLPPPPVKRTDWRCPANIVEATQDNRGNVFAKWLVGQLGDKAKDALRMYRCSTYPPGKKHPDLAGAMIWWQIGADGLHRTGKVMKYMPDGHRDKSFPPSWVHRLIFDSGMGELGIGQCLFGEHLLFERPNDEVCLVEAEKTAVMCSIFYPKSVWVATGGSHNFTLERCMALSGRRVTAFPDAGCFMEWSEKGADISLICGSLTVSDVLEGYEDGSDLADHLLPENKFAGSELFRTFVPSEPIPDTLSPAKVTVHAPSPVDGLLAIDGVSVLVRELDIDMARAVIKPITTNKP